MVDLLGTSDFDAYFTDHYRRAVRTLTSLTGSHAVAEDVLHEALARAWERRARIERLDAYVMVTAINLTRSRWRKLRLDAPGALPDEPSMTHSHEPSIDLRRAIAALPRRQRQAAVLFYICDMKIADVANYLGLSSGGVKNALHSARSSLAIELGPSYMTEATK